jgi:PKD repeat protein
MRCALFLMIALSVRASASCVMPPADPVIDYEGEVTRCAPDRPEGCVVSEAIQFTVAPAGGSQYDDCIAYAWNFGDGSTSTAVAPSHTFSHVGTFAISVTVSTPSGAKTATVTISFSLSTVVPIIDTFVASATRVRAGEPVTLTWSTRYAHTILITPIGYQTTEQDGSYTFVPRATETYTISADGPAAKAIWDEPITILVAYPRRHAVRH